MFRDRFSDRATSASLLRVGGGRSRPPTRLSWKVGHFAAKNSGCVSGKSRVWSIHRRGSFRLLVIKVTDGIASVVISRREKRTEKGPKVGSE